MKEPVQPFNRDFPLPAGGRFTALQVRTVAYAPTEFEREGGEREVVWYSSVEGATKLNPFFGIYGVFNDSLVEHIADRDTLEDAMQLVNGLGGWVEPEQAASIETLLDTPIQPIAIAEARRFLHALGKSSLAYHIDEDPADCISHVDSTRPAFAPEVAAQLRERVAECMLALGYSGAWQVYSPPGLSDDEAADLPLPSVAGAKAGRAR
jgi:hypothetical protein